MKPQLLKKPEMTLVGIVGCGSDVSQLDICGLWERFDGQSKHVKHQVEGKGYEIHVQEKTDPPIHFCLVGVEVQRVEHLPGEMFAKIVPACEYAVFTHQFRDGGFSCAFEAVYDWLERSEYASAYPFDIQCYDSRFRSPEDPDSVVEIWVPVTFRQR